MCLWREHEQRLLTRQQSLAQIEANARVLCGGGGEPEVVDLDGVAVAPCESCVCIMDRHIRDCFWSFGDAH
jgi:hypothetical protein